MHDVAVLRMTEDKSGPCATAGKSRVRDRIFETACELFYRHGIRGVGVDAIAAQAGSNKMSFYRSFASKDALPGGTQPWPATPVIHAAKWRRCLKRNWPLP
jgi:Bacterial regulatory proteins, tetR family